MSSCPYLTTPARSAWPGRGRVTDERSGPPTPAAISGSSGSTCIVRRQFSQSLFGIISATGAPVVRPWRMPRDRLGPIGFDRHAAAAAVAALAAPQLGGDRFEIDRQTRRKAFENHHERLAVRLACCEKTQHCGFILSEVFAHSDCARRVVIGNSARRRSCTSRGDHATARRSIRRGRGTARDRSGHRRSRRADGHIRRRSKRAAAVGASMRRVAEASSSVDRAADRLWDGRRIAAIRSVALRRRLAWAGGAVGSGTPLRVGRAARLRSVRGILVDQLGAGFGRWTGCRAGRRMRLPVRTGRRRQRRSQSPARDPRHQRDRTACGRRDRRALRARERDAAARDLAVGTGRGGQSGRRSTTSPARRGSMDSSPSPRVCCPNGASGCVDGACSSSTTRSCGSDGASCWELHWPRPGRTSCCSSARRRSPSVEGIGLEPLPVDALAGAVCPAATDRALARIRQMAVRAGGWPGRFARLLWARPSAPQSLGRHRPGAAATGLR